jgi:hypothetical protein
MRRLVVLFSAATLSLVGGVIGASAVASGSTATTEPSSTEAHPIIGTWVLTDTSDPEGEPSLVAFTADGIFVDVESDSIGLGVWEATGPTSAALTFTGQNPPDEGGGSFTIRATFEVAPDGQSLTADYTLEGSGIEGVPPGEYGPGQVTGTRVVVEPMGTPVGSLEDLFGGFEEGTEVVEGTAVAEGTEVTSGTAMSEGTEVAAPPTTS